MVEWNDNSWNSELKVKLKAQMEQEMGNRWDWDEALMGMAIDTDEYCDIPLKGKEKHELDCVAQSNASESTLGRSDS